METLQAIRTRRSIRRFKNEPLDQNTIEKILEAAILAPSAKNSQPWRFTVVRGTQRDEMLRRVQRAIEQRVADGEDVGSSRSTLRVMQQAPVTILIHNAQGIHPWKARKEHESWWDVATVQSIGAAIENMLLAATQLGIGSLWIADIWEAYVEVNEWLETDDQLVAAVSLGWPDQEPRDPTRKPMEEVVRWME